MVWIGLIAGAVIGGLIGHLPGAIALGFVGWLVGLIVKSQTTPAPRAAVPAPAHAPAHEPAALQALARRVAQLESRVAMLEGKPVPAAPEEPLPEAPFAASPGIVPSGTPVVAAPMPEAAPAEPAAQKPEAPEAPAPATPPAPPSPPNPIVAWLFGGNTIARVGLLILFLGLAFLLKYAVDRALIPPELRIAGVAAVGVALLVLGWKLRERRRPYALGLQGGGVAVLYLTTFAALRLYGLLPPVLAFALLAAIAVFSAVLAVAEDALVLAVFGAGGGFLAPILASTGAGSHVMLFSYYVLLNLGIAGIAFYRSWRALNVMGFLFTFVIGSLWGWRYYTPDYFATTEPFLVAFFLLYVAIVLIQAKREEPLSEKDLNTSRPYLDGMLLFGVPLAAFGLQAALLKDTEFGLAFSCVAAAALYLALAGALRKNPAHGLLTEIFLSLGVVFATVAIPFALDVRWTSAAWAVEGAAVVWVSVRQRRRLGAAFGLLLQLAAGAAYVLAYPQASEGLAWVDPPFLGAALVALAGLWTSRLLARPGAPVGESTRDIVPFAFVWGIAWWLFAGHHDIRTYAPAELRIAAHLAFVAATVAFFSLLAQRIAWKEAAWPAFAFWVVLLAGLLLALTAQSHPLQDWGFAAWPLAAAVHFRTLARHEDEVPKAYAQLEHAAGLLVLASVLTLELHWWAVDASARHGAWSAASIAVVPALLVLAIAARAADGLWPVAKQPRAYRLYVPLVFGAGLVLWMLYANVSNDGRSDPLPYLPFLNALDLAHLLVAVAAAALVLAWRRSGIEPPAGLAATAPAWVSALAFLWLNAVLLRTLHHWADIPYRLDPMLRSMLVQASLSIFWSLLALGLMVYATRTARRAVWIAGASLMGVVVLKLFLVELSHVGAVERFVSFIVVGLLMLLIGYTAPVPPRTGKANP